MLESYFTISFNIHFFKFEKTAGIIRLWRIPTPISRSKTIFEICLVTINLSYFRKNIFTIFLIGILAFFAKNLKKTSSVNIFVFVRVCLRNRRLNAKTCSGFEIRYLFFSKNKELKKFPIFEKLNYASN